MDRNSDGETQYLEKFNNSGGEKLLKTRLRKIFDGTATPEEMPVEQPQGDTRTYYQGVTYLQFNDKPELRSYPIFMQPPLTIPGIPSIYVVSILIGFYTLAELTIPRFPRNFIYEIGFKYRTPEETKQAFNSREWKPLFNEADAQLNTFVKGQQIQGRAADVTGTKGNAGLPSTALSTIGEFLGATDPGKQSVGGRRKTRGRKYKRRTHRR